MKKKMIWLLPLSFILTVVTGCQTVQEILNIQKPTASLKGLNFENISLDSATLLFDIEIKNPYPVTLPLVDVDYNLSSDAGALFSGNAELASNIPAKQVQTVSLPVKISYLDLVTAFKGIRPGSKVPYNAELGLSVNAPTLGRLRLPLNKQGELSVPAIPNIDEIDWKKILFKKTGQR